MIKPSNDVFNYIHGSITNNFQQSKNDLIIELYAAQESKEYFEKEYPGKTHNWDKHIEGSKQQLIELQEIHTETIKFMREIMEQPNND